MKKNLSIRISMMLVGNLMVGFAIALFRITNLGTDPFTTMNLGLSSFTKLSFGFYTLLVNLILVLFALLFVRNQIGLGTIINMIGSGYIADFFVYMYIYSFGSNLSLALKLVILVLAVFVITLGFSIYLTSELGVAPYDTIALIIIKLSNNKIPFAAARVMTDLTCVIVGFSFGAVVGISTVITAFFTGPLVQFFKKRVYTMLIEKEQKQEVV
ncbi:YczE/YyaS/YitT family protein [Niallia sp. FSL R7-0271]|uniref:YczE/YyaS/YitT family protein n=1 Tax=Niallia sp. FSL R7-0271 TaxID=2921678 RepID=UPI0030F6E1D8